MRIKQDFVTNSSSTSFIFGVPEDAKDRKIRMLIELDLDKHGTIIDTIAGLRYHWNEMYFDGDIDDEELQEDKRYQKAKKIIEDGGTVHVVWVSNEDDMEGYAFYEKGIDNAIVPNDIEIIDKGW